MSHDVTYWNKVDIIEMSALRSAEPITALHRRGYRSRCTAR